MVIRQLRFFVSAIATTAVLSTQPAGAEESPPVAVIVERADYRLISDPLEALGTLRANETVRLSSNVADTIASIHFEDGQTVDAGQLLVELKDDEERALLDEARATSDEAARQADRLARLVDDGTAAESLLDEQRREAVAAKARLAAARSRLEDRLITAPFAGRVGLRNVSPGDRIGPEDVITTLVDDAEMKLDFSVPSLFLPSLGPGVRIEATTPVYPGRNFVGEVVSIDSGIDPVTRAITVRARVPNPDRTLVPGMLMTIDLARAERDALVISESAIIAQGALVYALRVNTRAQPNLVEQIRIELGARQPGRVEVISGLAAGDLVITHGTQKVRPGASVAIRAIDDGSTPIADLLRDDYVAMPGD